MEQNIKISVIVPVYNVEEYMIKCLQSITRQTYRNMEIIVINDGSTDSSLKICEQFARNDSRVVLVSQENLGLSEARNTGLRIASGEYVTFVDSDDWLEPDAVEVMLSGCGEDTDLVITNFFRNYLNSEKLNVCSISGYTKKEIVIRNMLCNNGIQHSAWGKLYKRKLFSSIKYPKGKYFEDFFTTYHLADKAHRINILPAATYHYRYQQKSITASKNNIYKKYCDMYLASKYVFEFISQKYPDLFDTALNMRLYYLLKMLALTERKSRLYNQCKKDINGIKRTDINRKQISANVKIKYTI